MKILFVRHGESTDDVEDRYGGWADFELTDKGKLQLRKSAVKIEKLGEKFQVVLTSPLKRATQSAQIISKKLKLPFNTFEYAKEMNRYGVLTGMKKTEALQKYPDQVKKLDNDEYVDGSERRKDLEKRVKKAVDLINKRAETSLIVVTHGSFLKCLFECVFGKKITKKEDGGFVLMEFKDGIAKPLLGDGIDYE